MISNILVPTDGSETSRKALRTAIDLAKQYEAKLHLLHDIETHPSTMNPSVAEDLVRKQQKQANELLKQEKSLATEEGVEVQTAFRQDPQVHEAILEYVDEREIDMIVMGTHGRSGLNRLMIGSTAENTLRTASVPILVVPSDEENE